MLHQYFIDAKEDGTILDGKAIANEAERLELKTKAPFLLAQVLFDTDMINQIKLHRGLFLRFCLDDKRSAQRYLLGGIELKIFENKKVILPKTAHMDFETAAKNAFQHLFPDCAVKHCLFHLFQSLYKKVQKEKMKALWGILEIEMVLRCLSALAFNQGH